MNTDKAIERIKKLLSLAESSNPYEAAQAMGRAQELMSKHRIDAAQVQDADAPIEAVVKDNLFAIIGGRQMTYWKSYISMSLGEANGLSVYWSWMTHEGHYVRCIKAVGQPSVVRVAGFAFQFVVAEIDRLAKQYTGQGRTWLNNFRMGAARAVSDRIEKQAAQDIPPESEGEEGLVPVNALATIAKEVERQAKTLGLRTISSGTSNYNDGAYRAGGRAGRNIEFRNGARGALTA